VVYWIPARMVEKTTTTPTPADKNLIAANNISSIGFPLPVHPRSMEVSTAFEPSPHLYCVGPGVEAEGVDDVFCGLGIPLAKARFVLVADMVTILAITKTTMNKGLVFNFLYLFNEFIY